jgi:hypothetical protein
MASGKSASGSAQGKIKSSTVRGADPTIPNYDAQTVDEVTRRLRRLSQAELAKLESYERQGRGRATVLARIAALRGEAPWTGYDDMEAEEVNDALKKRDGDTARAVLDYERQHKARTTIIEFAQRQRDAAAGSASTRSSGAKARGSSRQRSSSGRSTRAAQTRRGKSTQASRSKSRSSGAGRSPSSAGARSTAPADAKRRMTATARNAGARTEKAAKGAGRAVGTAAEDTGHAVGTAAKKAKGPALTAGAVAVALGGGMVLGSKLLPKRRILGIPIPTRRSRLMQAANDAIGKRVSAVNDGIQRIASGATKD